MTTLQKYFENKDMINDNIHEFVCYRMISLCLDNPTKDDYEVIAARSLDVYFKSDETLDLFDIVDFFATNIAEKTISLDELNQTSKWDLVDAYNCRDVEYIHQSSLNKYKEELKTGYYKDFHGEKILKKEFIIEYSTMMANLIRSDMHDSCISDVNSMLSIVNHVQDLNDAKWKENLKNKTLEDKDISQYKSVLQSFCVLAESECECGKLPKTFRDFIRDNIAVVHDYDDLVAFRKHLEATYAFIL